MADKPTNAQLQELLTGMTNRATAAEERVAQLTADLASANERADQETKARQEAEKLADQRLGELASANASLKAYKGSATKARREATILKRDLSPQVRPIGAIRPVRNDEEAADRAASLEAAFALDTTEIVFSDGRREIRELAPLAVTGDAWLQRPNNRELNHDPVLEIVGEKQKVELAGFGLVNEAGEQVAYCPLPTPIEISRGQKMRIPLGVIRF